MNISNYIFTVDIFSPCRLRLIRAYLYVLCGGNANHYGELPTRLCISFQAYRVLKIYHFFKWCLGTAPQCVLSLGASDVSVINKLVPGYKLGWASLRCISVSWEFFVRTWTGFPSCKWFLTSGMDLFYKNLSHCRLHSLLTIYALGKNFAVSKAFIRISHCRKDTLNPGCKVC